MKIREAIERDLSREIEEIIKVTQDDEQTVHGEISEYVATGKIRQQYRTVLKAVADAPADPHEGVGIWVSGFFGSGKSAFAKNLGHVLDNRQVLGQSAARLFASQLEDEQCAAFIDSINARTPYQVVMFDVQTDRASGGTSAAASISFYMYRALLRTLRYAEDLNIADLEQSLEADGRLQEFIARFEQRHKARFEQDPERFRRQLASEQWRWRYRRKLAQKVNEASATLYELDPDTYESPDSWARTIRPIEVTPALLVEKTFELAARRCNGNALSYIIDEVGGFVAQSVDKIEDLRVVVEQLGKESKNRIQRKSAVAPVWIVVTSQEKLDEVVEALDSKRVEIARLRDRFKYEIDLAPSDIREVAMRRVLRKTEGGAAALGKIYDAHEGRINQSLNLERSSRQTQVSREDFINYYPYPPHFIDLSIEIISGIRLQPGAARHLGGSNRTIIKQAYEMLVAERTGLAEAELGRMVTIDLIFELVEGNLSSEKQRDISDIEARYGQGSWPVRVAKALCLLEMVRDLPRTESNLTAVLCDQAGEPGRRGDIRGALSELETAEFVRHSPDGFKLQTASEKTWSTERRAIDTKGRERAEIRRNSLHQILKEPKLRNYSFKGLKTFRVGLTVDEVKLEDGDIPFHVICADDGSDFARRCRETQTASRLPDHRYNIFWILCLTPEIDNLVGELNQSQKMINKYDHLRGQGKISHEEISCLEDEKHERKRTSDRLWEKVAETLQAGAGFFRGVSKDGSALGHDLAGVVRAMLDHAVPDLYPKLEMGARSLKGNEAEVLLTAANLSALPQVFYAGDHGLGLVKQESGKYVPDTEAPVAREILDHIRGRNQYGEKVTGRDLERGFCGLEYGWDTDLIRMVLAVLLRASAIEVSHQGRRFRDHRDALGRVPLTNKPAFRSASFAPRKAVDLKTLAIAAEHFEELTGQEIDIEEGAIAKALKSLAEQERNELLPAMATVRANDLPAAERLHDYQITLEGLLEASSDDCVRTLAEEGESLQQTMSTVRRIRSALSCGASVAVIVGARRRLERQWPEVQRYQADAANAEKLSELATRLDALVSDQQVYLRPDELGQLSGSVAQAYRDLYTRVHDERHQVYAKALDIIRGRDEWLSLFSPERLAIDPSARQQMHELLAPLARRRCSDDESLVLDDFGELCSTCGGRIATMESDLLAVHQLSLQVVERLLALISPHDAKLQHVRVRDLWQAPILNEGQVRQLIEQLEAVLMKAIASGGRVILE